MTKVLNAALMLCVGAVCVAPPTTSADVLIAPDAVEIVDFVLDTPLTNEPGDPERGLVFVNRTLGNCLACHEVTSLLDDHQFHGEVGLNLDYSGEIYTIGELRARIVNPKEINPDSMMPAFYRTAGLNRVPERFQGPILTAQQVEDVVAYVATLREE